MITRRRFITSLGLAAGYSVLPFGRGGFAFGASQPVGRRMIVLFLRGAVDGLSVVVPYGESEYYAKRSSIALNRPGEEGGVLNLDGHFGLHPSLSTLMPYWQDRSLAFVHATGFPSNIRSHFEAQDIIESGSLHTTNPHGWMNSLIAALPDVHSTTRALSFSASMPKIFIGPNNVATVSPGLKPDSKTTFNNPKAEHAFDMLYSQNKTLDGLFQEGKNSRDQLIGDLKKEMELASNNAPYPDGFPGQAARLAAMINQDPTIQLVFMDIGGWDTHVQQGNAKGQLAGKLEKLGEGLATLAHDLGPKYQETIVMVISEFGRTVAENGNGGTDHGHGNAMWLMGGDVKGGKVWGRWPGLAPNQLFEQRDLAATTDFRSVIGAVLSQHFGLDQARIATILDEYKPDNALSGLV